MAADTAAYNHAKATEKIINECWKNRYNEIYGKMSSIMGKMSREEREFLMNQLNDNQLEAYQKMNNVSERMDIERRFINIKQNAIKLARTMPDDIRAERCLEGILKGYEGERLENYVTFPHLQWDGEVIRFYSMLIRLQKHLCIYLAKLYDGKATAKDIALIKYMETIADKCFAFADDCKIAENISPNSKERIISANEKLQETLGMLGIIKMEIPAIITDGIDNAIILAMHGGKLGTIYVLSQNSHKYANAIVDLYESRGFVCRAIDNHGSINIMVSWNY